MYWGVIASALIYFGVLVIIYYLSRRGVDIVGGEE